MQWTGYEGEEAQTGAAAAPEKAVGRKKSKTKAEKKAVKRQRSLERRLQATAALIQELNSLRSVLKEIAQQLTLKQDAQLMQLIQALEGNRSPASEDSLPATKRLAALLKKVQDLKLKPKKGRLKDLVHLSRLLDALADKLAG